MIAVRPSGTNNAPALAVSAGSYRCPCASNAPGTTADQRNFYEAVWQTLQRRAVTLTLSLDYLGPARIGDWLEAVGEVVGHDEHMAQVRGRLYGPRHQVLGGLGAFALLSRHRTLKTRS